MNQEMSPGNPKMGIRQHEVHQGFMLEAVWDRFLFGRDRDSR